MKKYVGPFLLLMAAIAIGALGIWLSFDQFMRDRRQKESMKERISVLEDRADALDKRIRTLEQK